MFSFRCDVDKMRWNIYFFLMLPNRCLPSSRRFVFHEKNVWAFRIALAEFSTLRTLQYYFDGNSRDKRRHRALSAEHGTMQLIGLQSIWLEEVERADAGSSNETSHRAFTVRLCHFSRLEYWDAWSKRKMESAREIGCSIVVSASVRDLHASWLIPCQWSWSLFVSCSDFMWFRSTLKFGIEKRKM